MSVTGSASCVREVEVPEVGVIVINDWMFTGNVWGRVCACVMKMLLNHSLTF